MADDPDSWPVDADVASAALAFYEAMPKNGKPQPCEFTVFAAVLVSTTQDRTLHVVAAGSGTKCLPGSRRSPHGDLVNDCHAEAVTRRSLVSWLYGEAELAVRQYEAEHGSQGEAAGGGDASGHSGKPQANPRTPADTQPSGNLPAACPKADAGPSGSGAKQAAGASVLALQPNAEGAGLLFALKPGVRFHMYVSQPPCGDASIISLPQLAAGAQAATPATPATVARVDAGVSQSVAGAASAAAVAATTEARADVGACGVTEGTACAAAVAAAEGEEAQTSGQLPGSFTLAPNQQAMDVEGEALGVGSQRQAGAGEGGGQGEGTICSTEAVVRVRTGAKALKLVQQRQLPEPVQQRPQQAGQNQMLGEQQEQQQQQQPAQQLVQPLQRLEEGEKQQRQQQQQQQQQQLPAIVLPGACDVEAGPQELGLARRKPGKGEPTLSMSCSDKLARWALLGLQGSLLVSLLAAPIRLSTLTVGLPPTLASAQGDGALVAAQQALHRAVVGRAAAASRQLPPSSPGAEATQAVGTAASYPRVGVVPSPDPRLGLAPTEQRKVGSGAAISWQAPAACCLRLEADHPAATSTAPPAPAMQSAPCSKPAGKPASSKPHPAPSTGTLEVLVAGDGCKAGLSKSARAQPRQWPRLCRAALLHRFCGLAEAHAGACCAASVASAATAASGGPGCHQGTSSEMAGPGLGPQAQVEQAGSGWGHPALTCAPSIRLLLAALSSREGPPGRSLSQALTPASRGTPLTSCHRQQHCLPSPGTASEKERTTSTASQPAPQSGPLSTTETAFYVDSLKAASAALRACPYGEVKAACGALSGGAQAWQQARSAPSPFECWIPKPPHLSEFTAQRLYEALGVR